MYEGDYSCNKEGGMLSSKVVNIPISRPHSLLDMRSEYIHYPMISTKDFVTGKAICYSITSM